MNTERLDIKFVVNDVPIEMGMTVPSDPIPLKRMLPILRQVTSAFGNAVEAELAEAEMPISCKAGCGACCRQLVPISETEAFELAEQVAAMDEPRRSEIVERFEKALKTLNSIDYFGRLEKASIYAGSEYEELLREYFRLGIACPFLENESCSIHLTRPITCREYLVTSPPELCDSAEGDGIKNVKLNFQLKEALISLSQKHTTDELPYVPLIRAREWARDRIDDLPGRTGKEWINAAFNFLKGHTEPHE